MSIPARLHVKTGLTCDQFNFIFLLMTSYHDTYSNMAAKALKYRLAVTAQNMIEALRPRPLLLEEMELSVLSDIGTHRRKTDPDIETPILSLPPAPVWLELEEPVLAANREIAGIFFACSDREVEQTLEGEHWPSMRKVLESSVKQPGHEYKWSLHFITGNGTPITRYEYREQSRVWFILPAADGQQICPTGKCQEQPREGGTFDISPVLLVLSLWPIGAHG